MEGPGLGERSRGSPESPSADPKAAAVAFCGSCQSSGTKPAQPKGTFWLMELKGPGVGFRPRWIQDFKKHRNWVPLSSAFLCWLASLSGRLALSGSRGGPQKPQPASHHLGHLGEAGTPRRESESYHRHRKAGGRQVGAAVVIGGLRGQVCANLEHRGLLPRNLPLLTCRGWSRNAFWKKLCSKSRFWRCSLCWILRRSARQHPLKKVSNCPLPTGRSRVDGTKRWALEGRGASSPVLMPKAHWRPEGTSWGGGGAVLRRTRCGAQKGGHTALELVRWAVWLWANDSPLWASASPPV